MHYICKDSLCDCYGNCPANHRLTVTEHSDVDDDTGLSLYFAICPTTGQTLTSLYPESVKVAPTLARWGSHHGLIWSCRPGGGFARAGFRLPEWIFTAA